DRVGTYNAYTTTTAFVQHVNVSELNLSLYRLDKSNFILLNGGDWWERWDKFSPDARQLLRQWTARVPSTLNIYHGSSIPLSADGRSALAPGFYFLEVRAPGVSDTVRHMLVVSKANATLKVTTQEGLVWTTDLASGQPIAGLDVTLLGPAGAVLASGRTNQDGIFFSKLTATEDLEPWDPLLAIAGTEDSLCAASTDWANGISPWQFNLPTEYWVEPYRAYFYTDRSIYRPGQTVYFKGILRADDDGHYSLPEGVRSLQVVVRDEMGREIYRTDLSLNDMGTLHGELQLSEEAGLGSYYLNAELGDRTFGTSFRVAEYRRPEFTVSVNTDKTEYTQGDEIVVQVAANYYFGGPVANAPLQWRLMSQDSYFYWTGKEHYDFTDADYESRGQQTFYGELVSVGQGTTDAEGNLIFRLPADIARRRNSQLFTIEASITDPSNQEVSGRTSAIVHKGLFYVGLAPVEYIGTVGKDSKVKVVTVDSKSITVTNVPVTVVFNELRWYNVQEEADDGRFYWQWKLEETPVYTTTVTTDAAGTALATFRPEKGGSYRVRAFARDRRENEIRSSTYLWISSESFVSWQQENNDRIELVTDKKSYQPGETARILIPSPFQGQVKALLTVERGHIYSHRVLTLTSNSQQVEVPILAEYAPNAYVSVVLVKGSDRTNPIAAYRVGYVDLNISTAQQVLTVQITPNQTKPYLPGSRATFDLLATDYTGRGVQAELSVQLVDLAVLALTDSTQGTMLDNFYRRRGLSVRTGATLAISVDRLRERAEPPSGKGGDGAQPGLELVRQRFLDTAYWNATVRTDAQGKAQVTVNLPDNLTTWRATAKAVTADTRVGEGQAEIVTTKELLVRSVAPRFFVLGDRVQLGAVIHNNTAAPLTVEALLQGKGVTIEGGARRTEIAALGQATVYWQATVSDVPSVTLTWRVAGGSLSDALELTLPVYHYSAPETVATAGQIPAGESRVETLRLPERLDPTQGELTVQLDPSLAAGMRDALSYLEAYPYHCIEQTVSRFLPNVITYRALKKLGISNPQLEARLPQYVTVGLQRIYAMQHYDGGWGWWLTDDSQPFISAYVLLGLKEAAGAGFAVDNTVMDRAVRHLRGVLDSTSKTGMLDNNSRAFVLYVLAECDQGDLGRTIALYEKRDLLANYGKAYLLMALKRLEPDEASRVRTLVSDLTNAALVSATGAHWEEQSTDYWTMNTNTRSTAIVLAALLRADPQHALLPNTVRWLMTARKQGHWESTQETAWSVMALTDFMVATGELQADYDYQVTLNAKALGQGTVTTQNVGETRKLVVAIQDLLLDESNRLVLERLTPQPQQSGRGQLYYSLYLRYYLPVEDVVALNRGIVVSRQYELVDRPNRPISSAEVGDVIRVKLTLIAPQDLHYLVLEDPLPAGCEALDTSLKTTSGVYEAAELVRQDGRLPYWWYFTHSELRDEKVALFATYLAKGTYEYTYLMRASVSGRFLTMPTYAYQMYFPEVFGRGDGGTFTVSE
ncbi:MAG: hypothetical protein FJ026_02440, partial [Chloroflexi bacterium]|nr:hypothetical protein [Chloroflexota bacterium]